MRTEEPAPLSIDDASMPSNLEAEQALLGAIFLKPAIYERVNDRLRPEHFAEPAHGHIFDAIGKLRDRGQTVNPIAIKNHFAKDDRLQEIGGEGYLKGLAESAVSLTGTEHYAEIIIDCWERRRIIEFAKDAIVGAQAQSLDLPAARVREELETQLLNLQDASTGSHNGPRSLGDFAAQALATAERAYKRQSKLTGVPSRLTDLDCITGGFQPSDLIYLAGRPSMGKSALAGTIALNAARRGHPVFLATPEMSGEQVALRTISIGTRISAQRIRTGDLRQEDFVALVEDVEHLRGLPVKIDDLGGISLAQLRARVRRFMLECPRLPGAAVIDGKGAMPLVIVDYIQLMSPAGRRREQSRNDDVSELSQGLKALAKEFGVPVIALSQLSRAVESRENKHPTLSDLRDSGSLEQDADIVAFIFREEYYLSRAEPSRRHDESGEHWNDRYQDWEQRLEAARNRAELDIAKQRHGPTGKAVLRFNHETTSFENFARQETADGPRYSALGA